MAKPGRWKRILKIAGVLVLMLGLVVVGTLFFMSQPRPEGTSGEAAENLTETIEAAVNLEAWDEIGAVRWNFGGRQEHVWDRERGFSRVRFGDVEVQQTLNRRWGIATENGVALSGGPRHALVEEAYAHFCNDAFWLNPIAKFRDDGVTRQIVSASEYSSTDSLLVAYSSGGVTPGDAYLWVVDENGLPEAWHMWVSIIPIGGARATWGGWTTLDGGAKVSTVHEMGPITLEITDLQAAPTLEELEIPGTEPGQDPFQALLDASQ